MASGSDSWCVIVDGGLNGSTDEGDFKKFEKQTQRGADYYPPISLGAVFGRLSTLNDKLGWGHGT